MILLALLCILPHDTCARERIDQIEVQQVFSWSGCEKENGDVDYHLKPTFTQLLFRRWDRNRGEHVIEAWRMAKPEMKYQFVHARGVHEIRWFDGQVERVVETKSMVYSATDLDSEVSERTQHPKENRTDLVRLKGRE
jgi:hypothetical protein